MSTYVFDHALERERERLQKLERWLDPGTIRHLTDIGVAPGWRCLEVGAGAGSITRWLAERVGSGGSVFATDLDLKFLDDVPSNVEVATHDITSEGLPPDHFDLAHTRAVLMHLPARNEAFKRMVEAVKPGGWLLIEDMEFVTWVSVVPSEAHDRVAQAVIALFRSAGAEPYMGRMLSKMMIDAGLEEVSAEGRILIGARTKNPGIEQFQIALAQLREPLIATGLCSGDDIDEEARLLDDPEWAGMPPSQVAAWGRKPSRPA